MTKPDSLIFDLDGTLWDAAVPTARGWNDALAELGVGTRVTVDAIRSVAGTPFLGCVEILVPEICPPTKEVLKKIDDREKSAIAESGGELFEGVEDGLRRLARVYPLYVVSNCQDWYLGLFFEKTGLGQYFAGGDCNGLSGQSKAEMLRRLARDQCLQSAVYVGDTQGDHDSACQAGMSFGLAHYGFGSVDAETLGFHDFGALVEYFLAVAERQETAEYADDSSG